MLATFALSSVEHDEAQQAKDRLVNSLRNMSSVIRSNVRSNDDVTGPGRGLAREHLATSLMRETTAVRCAHLSCLELLVLNDPNSYQSCECCIPRDVA